MGASTIKETIYGERFKHCEHLRRMGADIEVGSSRATFTGPSKLFASKVEATDLRGGASMVIAALLADGVTEIDEIYHIDRGYDKIDEKLNSLGAKMWRETK